jgi:hypothetical protein
VISTIVNNLLDINKKYVLLAPTGRAAKVIIIIRINLLLRFTKKYISQEVFRRSFFTTATKQTQNTIL